MISKFNANSLVLVFLFHACAASQEGQQVDESLFPIQTAYQMHYVSNGRLETSSSTILTVAPPFRNFEILQSAEVVAELDLSDGQEMQLEELLQKGNEAQKTFSKSHRLPASRQDAIETYNKFRSSYESTMEEILLAHQMKRLEQIKARIQIRRIGLLNYCKLISKDAGFEVSQLEIIELEKVVEKEALNFQTGIQKLIEDFSQSLFELLPESPDKTVIKDRSAGSNLSLDLLLLHLDEIVEDKKRGETNVSPDSSTQQRLENLLTTNEAFILKDYGLWEKQVVRLPLYSSLRSWLETDLQDNGLGMDLVDFQKNKIEELIRDISEREREAQEEFNRRFEIEGDSKQVIDALRQGNSDIDEFARQTFFDEVVLPHQLSVFDKYLNDLEAAKWGMLSLVSPNRMTDYTNTARKKIVEFLKNQAEELKKDAIRLEEQFIDKCLARLEEKNRGQIQEMIGSQPKYLSPSQILFQTVYRDQLKTAVPR